MPDHKWYSRLAVPRIIVERRQELILDRAQPGLDLAAERMRPAVT